MTLIEVFKYSATGNEFALVDLRLPRHKGIKPSDYGRLAKKLSNELQADGLVLIRNAASREVAAKPPRPMTAADRAHRIRLEFFNPDGSRAFCGNGTRAAGFHETRVALRKLSGEVIAETDSGDIPVAVNGPKAALSRLDLPKVLGPVYVLHPKRGRQEFVKVWAGNPHAVHFVPDVDQIDVEGWGRKVRNDPLFRPGGANVDFLETSGASTLRVRTFERGVERETKSCGSGALACAFAAWDAGRVRTGRMLMVNTKGGQLIVRKSSGHASLSGQVIKLYSKKVRI